MVHMKMFENIKNNNTHLITSSGTLFGREIVKQIVIVVLDNNENTWK